MLTVIYIFLGFLMQESHGHFSTTGISVLTFSMLAIVYSSIKRVAVFERFDNFFSQFRLLLLIVLIFSIAIAIKPGFNDANQLTALYSLKAILWLVAVVLLIVFFFDIRAKNVEESKIFFKIFLILCGFLFLARLLALLASPNPFIDVFVVTSQGVDYLLDGKNPYSQSYPDIYHGRYGYAAGYTYWPSYLIFSIPFRLLGDVRLITVFSDVVTSYFIFQTAIVLGIKKNKACLWVLVWALFPISLFFLEQSWIDSFIVMGLIIFVWALLTKKLTVAAISLGIFAASKQYAPLVGIVALPYLIKHFGIAKAIRTGLISGTIFLLFIIPFALVDFEHFYKETIGFLIERGLRIDALSFPSLLARGGDLMKSTILPSWFYNVVYFIAIGLGTLSVALKKSPDMKDFMTGLVVTFGLIFVFGKVAFCNYYYLIAFFSIIAILSREKIVQTS